MDFYQAVKSRRTVREFAPRPVEEAKVKRALEAGLAAPSNAHLKSWEFVLLRDRDDAPQGGRRRPQGAGH